MSLLNHVLGPESKYDHRLPYTYEAIVAVAGVPGMRQAYVSDTLCGLLEKLADEKVAPSDAQLFEVRPGGEVPIVVDSCLGSNREWLRRPEACQAFEQLFAGHEKKGRCCYRDRSRADDGPFPVPGPEGPARG